MSDEHVKLLEAALVQQQIESFPGGKLALSMLAINALLTATQPGFVFKFSQLLDLRIGDHETSPQ